MTIPQLRQEAKDLRDLANRFLVYGEKHSFDDASRRLAELFRQVPLILGNRARGLTLEGVPNSWVEVSERADLFMANCYFAKPQGMQHCYIPFFMLLISNALLVLVRHNMLGRNHTSSGSRVDGTDGAQCDNGGFWFSDQPQVPTA
jgi:hypothetical protein